MNELARNRDEAEIRNVLDRLGDPADITEEARQRFGVPKGQVGSPGDRRGDPPLIGGLIFPVIGWFNGVFLP